MATKATKATSTTGAKGGAETADYDAIIVGGGHNGLVAVGKLADGGKGTPREPKGRGVAWTEERRRSDEGRRRLKAARRRVG